MSEENFADFDEDGEEPVPVEETFQKDISH